MQLMIIIQIHGVLFGMSNLFRTSKGVYEGEINYELNPTHKYECYPK